MNGFSLGLLLLTRPFEVWLASYILLQVIERKELVGWLNYILIGMNAFATITAIYGIVVGKSDTVLGGVFNSGLGAVLLASSIVLWIFWIFICVYCNMTNNKRGITIALSNLKNVDRIMLYFVVPASMLMCAQEMLNAVTISRAKMFHSAGTTVGFFTSLLVLGLDIFYLVLLSGRLKKYIVFGKKEIEIWRGNRQKIYKYNDISSVEQLELKSFFNCKYKISFGKNEVDSVIVNDERVEKVLNQYLEFVNKTKKRKGENKNEQ